MIYLVSVRMPTRDENKNARRALRTYTRRSHQAAKRKADQLAERFGARHVKIRPASRAERFPILC